MNPLDTIRCIYHSPRWMELVEQGWTTHEVIAQDGQRWAVMTYTPRPVRGF